MRLWERDDMTGKNVLLWVREYSESIISCQVLRAFGFDLNVWKSHGKGCYLVLVYVYIHTPSYIICFSVIVSFIASANSRMNRIIINQSLQLKKWGSRNRKASWNESFVLSTRTQNIKLLSAEIYVLMLFFFLLTERRFKRTVFAGGRGSPLCLKWAPTPTPESWILLSAGCQSGRYDSQSVLRQVWR